MIYWIALCAVALTLAACGKKGPLDPLEPDQYPRPYPKPIPIEGGQQNECSCCDH